MKSVDFVALFGTFLGMPLSPNFNSTLLKYLENHCFSDDSVLWKAMEYSLKSPGKRLRPLFVEEGSQRMNLSKGIVEPLASAIEMVHIFSLIHDDLPSMDNDDLRRGLPTTHKVHGEAQALLAGDALLSIAYEVFSITAEYVSKESFVSALRFFGSCIGPNGMIGGQSLELEIKNPNEEQLLEIQAMKTGALFQAAILTPLLLAGKQTRDPIFKEYQKYAEAFGFAFQIADDLEDEAQDQKSKASTKNILSIYGAERAKELAKDRLLSCSVAPYFSATDWLSKKYS